MRTVHAIRAVTAVVLLVSLFSLSGCSILGVIAYKLGQEEKTPAEFTPSDKPMLVLVESYRSQAAFEAAGDELAADLTELLKTNKVAPVISAEKLIEYRTAHFDTYDQKRIQTIGRDIGAGQVLYVNMKQLGVTTPTGGDVYEGTVDVRVKVVDVGTGRTLWPTGSNDGYQVQVEGEDAMVLKADTPSKHAVQSQMLSDLAEQIARLFYAYRPENDDHKKD